MKPAQTVRISIPEPCKQYITNGSSLPDGRVNCHSCARTLVSFHEMTDAELIYFLQNHNRIPCGTFRPDQLDQPFQLPETKSRNPFAPARFFWFFPLVLAWFSGAAQTVKSPPAKTRTTQQPVKKTPVLQGKVLANGRPVPGAAVYSFDNRQKIYLTRTDSSGLFALDAPAYANCDLVIEAAGFEERVIRLSPDENMTIIQLSVLVICEVKSIDKWERVTGGIPVRYQDEIQVIKPRFRDRLRRFFSFGKRPH